MAERSFAQEVMKLRAGAGEVFKGEGILAITKALLQSGVSYVGGVPRLTHFPFDGCAKRCAGHFG